MASDVRWIILLGAMAANEPESTMTTPSAVVFMWVFHFCITVARGLTMLPHSISPMPPPRAAPRSAPAPPPPAKKPMAAPPSVNAPTHSFSVTPPGTCVSSSIVRVRIAKPSCWLGLFAATGTHYRLEPKVPRKYRSLAFAWVAGTPNE